MTERPDPADSPEVAEVRRLLADARHAEPMPQDVVRRMDDVLAGLASHSPGGTPPEPGDVHQGEVVHISSRRRRTVAGLLVAAAAVVVGGVAVGPHLAPGSDSTGSAASQENAGGSADQSLGNTGNTGNTGNQQGTPTPPKAANSDNPTRLKMAQGLVVVRPRHFSADARLGRRLLDGVDATRSAQVPCTDVPGAGNRVAARYQRAPAVLVYRRAQGGTQVVDLYVCGNDRPVRSTTLPAP